MIDSSMARRTPMVCAMSTVIPPPGITPMRLCVSAKRATSDATRNVHCSATSKPPVTATPLIAPMIGLSISGKNRYSPLVSRGGHRFDVGGPRRLARQLFQVHAGAERGIGAGEDHHVDVGIGAGVADRVPQAARQGGVQRIARLRPIERDGGDAMVDIGEDGSLPVRARHGPTFLSLVLCSGLLPGEREVLHVAEAGRVLERLRARA